MVRPRERNFPTINRYSFFEMRRTVFIRDVSHRIKKLFTHFSSLTTSKKALGTNIFLMSLPHLLLSTDRFAIRGIFLRIGGLMQMYHSG
ncbi:hypothetical protein PUN28_016147 [Cardiocondyla obscurior]|uniref:Uncharacterized protein n=1 Tax=Cardiocondyla obscurior TaxID=286306 RepID=A0AAW2ER66_9HYME